MRNLLAIENLFWVMVAWAVVFAASKLFAANRVFRKLADVAQRRKAQPDSEEASSRGAVQAILDDLVALARITPQQAQAWSSLPIDKVAVQLLARDVLTLQQWHQLLRDHVPIAPKEDTLH